MKKILPLLIFVIFFLASAPAAYACTTNSDCPGNRTCNVSTGICATPNDTAGTGAGFAAPATTIQTAAQATTNTAPWTGSSGTFTNASNFVPLTNIPGLIGTNSITNAQGLTAFFNDLYKICIGVAATLAVLQIMRAGIMYMGGDSITETKEARALIATAIGGLLLVLSPVIVFSIINPKILSLNVGLNNLTPPATTQTATAAPISNPSNQICNGYSPTQWSEIPSGSSCNASLGAAWASLQDVCCTGTQQAGAVCCGKNIDYVTPVTPALLSANHFSIAYQAINYDTGKACLAYSDQGNFATQAACVTVFNKVMSASKGPTAVAESCTDTSSHTPTGAGWSTLQSLPSCPSQ